MPRCFLPRLDFTIIQLTAPNFSWCRYLRSTRTVYTATLFFLALALGLQAQTVIVSNIAQSSNGSVPVAFFPAVGIDPAQKYDEAQSFTTGSSATYLNSISIFFQSGGTGNGFSVDLHSGTSANPGTLLAPLSGSTAPTAAGNYPFTPTGQLTLSSNTTYWWVASVPADSGQIGFNIGSTASNAETSPDGWTIGDTFRQQPISGGWNAAAGSLMFKVNVSAIPEPSTYAAFFGVTAFAFAIHRRKRRTSGLSHRAQRHLAILSRIEARHDL